MKERVPTPLIVRVPWTPPAALTPNRRLGRSGWQTKLRNEAKREAGWATKAMLNGNEPPAWLRIHHGNIGYTVTIAWEKGRRRLDDDNALSAMKSAVDSMCDILGINDRRLRIRGVEQIRDRDGAGYTEFALWPE